MLLTLARETKVGEPVRCGLEVEMVSGGLASMLDDMIEEVFGKARQAIRTGGKGFGTEIKIGQPARIVVKLAERLDAHRHGPARSR